MRRWPVLLIVLLAIAGAWMFRSATAAQPTRSLEPQETVLDAAALAAGDHDRTRPAGDGLTAENGGGAYLAPPQQVIPFSDLLVSWRADVPFSATLTISVRTSADGEEWSPWAAIEESHDLFDERDNADQRWGAPVFAGKAAW
ncbi:MAG TPA: hypothetical protein VGE07_28090, partial [Herpetosiphonaceae bacterium]